MSAPQTSVLTAMNRGFAGMLVDSSDIKYTRSYANGEASAEIPFGQMVKQGASDNLCLRLTAAADVNKLLGVVQHSHAYEKDIELGDTGLKPHTTVGVLAAGTIWVTVEEAVAPGDTVRVFVSDTGHVAGQFGKTADTGKSVNISTWARYVSSTTGAGIAQLYFNSSGRSQSVAD